MPQWVLWSEHAAVVVAAAAAATVAAAAALSASPPLFPFVSCPTLEQRLLQLHGPQALLQRQGGEAEAQRRVAEDDDGAAETDGWMMREVVGGMFYLGCLFCDAIWWCD